jgi:hypothetical protein
VAILLVGAAFSLGLVSRAREGVFFSGDGGLKFLIARQLASGDIHLDLRLRAEPWIAELWARGFYPFQPPFVYEVSGRRLVTWALFFPLLTAPWYAAFGYHGLYVVPLVSLWVVWSTTWWLLRRLGSEAWPTWGALLGLVFATPLTLYGATYWEHTLGVALAWAGLALVLSPGARRLGSAVAAGLLLATAGAIRPELTCLAAIVIGAVWTPVNRAFDRREKLALVATSATTYGVFIAHNLLMYGQPFGLHAVDVLGSASMGGRVSMAAVLLPSMLVALVEYVPLAPVAAVLVVLALHRTRRRTDAGACLPLLAVTFVLYLLVVPLILPNDGGLQWGPRYLLILSPIVCAAAAIASSVLWEGLSSPAKVALAGGIVAAIAAGGLVNSYGGARALEQNYARRVFPAIEALRSDPARVIAVSSQYIPQELAALSQEKAFVLVDNAETLTQVAEAAHRHGLDRLVLLTWPAHIVIRGTRILTTTAGARSVSVAPTGSFGSYRFHEVVVTSSGELERPPNAR